MEVDHIGYLVRDIEYSVRLFESLGYVRTTEVVNDDSSAAGGIGSSPSSRNVLICFCENGHHRVELVSPNGHTDSVVEKTISRQGEGPYHICYRVPNLLDSIAQLRNTGWITVQPPAPARAFSGSLVAFMFRKGVGLIELVEYTDTVSALQNLE